MGGLNVVKRVPYSLVYSVTFVVTKTSGYSVKNGATVVVIPMVGGNGRRVVAVYPFSWS